VHKKEKSPDPSQGGKKRLYKGKKGRGGQKVNTRSALNLVLNKKTKKTKRGGKKR